MRGVSPSFGSVSKHSEVIVRFSLSESYVLVRVNLKFRDPVCELKADREQPLLSRRQGNV